MFIEPLGAISFTPGFSPVTGPDAEPETVETVFRQVAFGSPG